MTDGLDFAQLLRRLIGYGSISGDPADVAAERVTQAGAGWLGYCCAVAAPTAAGAELERLTWWVATAGRDWHTLAVSRTLVEIAPPASRPAEPGRLRVDPVLSHLPLLDLAGDLAGGREAGLTVAVGATPPPVTGYYDLAASLIVVNPAVANPELTLAHELGHALDQPARLALPTAEDFADTLAELLLVHRPRTLAAARPLIQRAEVAHHPRPSEGLPARGIESILVWRLGFAPLRESSVGPPSANRVLSQTPAPQGFPLLVTPSSGEVA